MGVIATPLAGNWPKTKLPAVTKLSNTLPGIRRLGGLGYLGEMLRATPAAESPTGAVIPALAGDLSAAQTLDLVLHSDQHLRPTANDLVEFVVKVFLKCSYQINGVNIPQIAVLVETYTEDQGHLPNASQSLPHTPQALGLYDGMQPLGCGLERLLYFQKGDMAEDLFDAGHLITF